MRSRLLSIIFLLSIVFSIPSLMRIPRFAPFVFPEVRTAAVSALEDMRKSGAWLVHLDLKKVERRGSKICFTWRHRYTSRKVKEPTNVIIQCVQ